MIGFRCRASDLSGQQKRLVIAGPERDLLLHLALS